MSKYLHADNKKIIDLAHNQIQEEGALHISRMLYYNTEYLSLSVNSIGDTGASLISEAVREIATLKTLILFNCCITSRGAEDFSIALAQNISLKKLDIGDNNLGDEGISHIAEGLKQNEELKELWIGGGVMTDKGAASLASALTVNNSLTMLHMGGAKGALTGDGLWAIAHSLVNKSKFVKLAIPDDFGCVTGKIFGSNIDLRLRLEVNRARKINLPPIEIEGEYIIRWKIFGMPHLQNIQF